MKNEYHVKLQRVRKYAKANMPQVAYHNFGHIKDVAKVCALLAKAEELEAYETFLLQTAGYMHDIEKEENAAARTTQKVLPYLGYTVQEAKQVACLIPATKLGTKPKNLLEKILCDADLDNLGRKDFLKKNHLLRVEQNKLGVADTLWFKQTYEFLVNHKYYTRAARKRGNEGLVENLSKVERLLLYLGGFENAD